MSLKSRIYLVVFFFSLASLAASGPGTSRPASGVFHLEAVWNGAGQEQLLKSWTLEDLAHLKQIGSRERDPVTGRLTRWQGVSLSSLVENSIESLSPDRRAQVDLVVLKSRTGAKAVVPRALITMYPVMLALEKDHRKLAAPGESRGPVYSVIPWSSHARILSEGLPIERYFLPQVVKIELTSYRERFSSLFLRRRTDPMAMRGEMIFMKNCIVCHSIGQGASIYDLSTEAETRHFAISGHPVFKGAPRLSGLDHRSLVTYLDAFRGENGIIDRSNPARSALIRIEASTH